MSSTPVKAAVEVPLNALDGTSVAVEEIPLPPPELWGELENATPADKAPEPSASASAPVTEEQPAPIEELEFIDQAHQRVIPLKHPFRFRGAEVRAITVRRLRVGEIELILRDLDNRTFSLFDIYARMCGLPAAVLRGLVDEDGDAVTAAAFDFLPRALRPGDD